MPSLNEFLNQDNKTMNSHEEVKIQNMVRIFELIFDSDMAKKNLQIEIEYNREIKNGITYLWKACCLNLPEVIKLLLKPLHSDKLPVIQVDHQMEVS